MVNPNKTIMWVVILVAIIAIVAILVNVGHTTGKASYETGEAEYGAEWWECWDDDDCDFGEQCIDHYCVEVEANLGVIFGCNPVDGNLLDCSGFVANQAFMTD